MDNALMKVLDHYNLYENKTKYKIVCPFHPDKNASLLISLDEDRWFCFGCGKSGGALEFLKYAEPKINTIDQYKLYYKIIYEPGSLDKVKLKRKTVKQIEKENANHLLAAEDYYYNLKTFNWLEVENEDINYMIKRGFSKEILNKTKVKITYNKNYPIVFPMMDMNTFRGWVCRTTDKEIEKDRKYLYNKGFSRATTIVGRYDNKVVFLVEGYMDMLKAQQFGLKYVGAILGWKITEEQIQKLKDKGVEEIISGLDNDDPGKAGTEELKKHFKVTRFQFKRGYKDIGMMDKSIFNQCYERTKDKRRRINGTS